MSLFSQVCPKPLNSARWTSPCVSTKQYIYNTQICVSSMVKKTTTTHRPVFQCDIRLRDPCSKCYVQHTELCSKYNTKHTDLGFKCKIKHTDLGSKHDIKHTDMCSNYDIKHTDLCLTCIPSIVLHVFC